MDKKKIIEIGIVCVLFLVMAGYVEKTEHSVDAGSRVIRASPGGHAKDLQLKVDAEGVWEDQDFKVSIPATAVTLEQAQKYFTKACEEIDTRFYQQGDDAEHVCHAVVMDNRYADQMVSAEWSLDSYQYVNYDGRIREENLVEESLVQASVDLTCGEYKSEYAFAFRVYPPERSVEEQLLLDIQKAVDAEGQKEGQPYFQLPKNVDGVPLYWSEPKQHLLVKVLFFEIIVLVLLYFVVRERRWTKQRERQEQMNLDYAEFVNKLLILLGSGMSLKQSLNRISARYLDKRQKKQTPERYLYEELLVTNYEIQDGESERVAYQKFSERTGLSCYHRLIRILIQNLQTGNRGLCELLGQEAAVALEERKALAKKLGEEAGTKMLLPLILMLGIVIAIIMVPAMQSFSI